MTIADREYDSLRGPHSPPSFRSQAEAAWLKDKMSESPGYHCPASSLIDERERRICIAASFKALARGFAPGHEFEDWIEAEQEVDEGSRPLPRR
jgi:hypothetical protein